MYKNVYLQGILEGLKDLQTYLMQYANRKLFQNER
jgi:hypothetical protein